MHTIIPGIIALLNFSNDRYETFADLIPVAVKPPGNSKCVGKHNPHNGLQTYSGNRSIETWHFGKGICVHDI